MITMLVFQYSVVVKGIERKLAELGYEVHSLTEDFGRVTELAEKTDLFIFYLPRGVTDDKDRLREISGLSHMIVEKERKIIYIAEKDDHEELVRSFPETRDEGWIDRPVNNDTLGSMVVAFMEEEQKSAEKKRILIVDDDPTYAGTVREWIKDRYRVDIVVAGMQAITFLAKNKVDLILLDYEMPIVDGPEVFQMLKQSDTTKDIPVVFLTGVGIKEGVQRVMALKPNGYILKSTTRADLVAFLETKL